MRTTIRKIALALALTSVTAGTALAHNVRDAILFDGKVVASACQMDVEGANGKVVNLGIWAPITVENLRTSWKPFKIRFTGCEQDQIAKVFVAGTAASDGLLANDASQALAAANTSIAVIHGKDEADPLLNFSRPETLVWKNEPSAVDIVEDPLAPQASYGIPFLARIVQNRGGSGSRVKAGDVTGTMNVFVDYR